MERIQIIGIVNVTPDSYFDGGKFATVDAAVKHAGAMLQEGADWIEIGGESTGPNSKDVSLEEERARTMPVIKAIKEMYPKAQIAIDTYKASLAESAIAAGASMVNDVTAGRSDPAIFGVVQKRNTPIVLMYAKDPVPRTTVEARQYDDVIATVREFLEARKQAALAAGIAPDRIILDPGLGHFVSSDPNYSFEIIARLSELAELGSPLLLSPSRKSFLAGCENLKTIDRLPGTIAASAIAVLHGASYIRTHDVAPVRRGCEIAQAIRSSKYQVLRMLTA